MKAKRFGEHGPRLAETDRIIAMRWEKRSLHVNAPIEQRSASAGGVRHPSQPDGGVFLSAACILALCGPLGTRMG